MLTALASFVAGYLTGRADYQHWIAPPAPRPKFYSAQDAVHLEDESGRVRLVGEVIRLERDREGGGLVTGASSAVTMRFSST